VVEQVMFMGLCFLGGERRTQVIGEVARPVPGLDELPVEDTTSVDVSRLKLRVIPAGQGAPEASARVTSPSTGTQPTLAPGYTEKELLVSGVADTYTGPAVGPAKPDHKSIPYTTRILLRYPTNPSRFSGRVLLEPFNTSRADPTSTSAGNCSMPICRRTGTRGSGSR
jgi:hypothetical protein